MPIKIIKNYIIFKKCYYIVFVNSNKKSGLKKPLNKNFALSFYSTVTDFAKFLG